MDCSPWSQLLPDMTTTEGNLSSPLLVLDHNVKVRALVDAGGLEGVSLPP